MFKWDNNIKILKINDFKMFNHEKIINIFNENMNKQVVKHIFLNISHNK